MWYFVVSDFLVVIWVLIFECVLDQWLQSPISDSEVLWSRLCRTKSNLCVPFILCYYMVCLGFAQQSVMAKLISSSSVFTTEFWEVVEVTNSKVAACVKASKEAYCISSGAVWRSLGSITWKYLPVLASN